MRTTSDVFTLVSASTLLLWKWSYRNVCVGWWGRTRTTQERWEKSKREGYVTSWLQGNSAKHLITAVPGNLNLSKKILCSPCLIAVDGCWPVMHDNACGSGCSLPVLIAVSLHSRWWTQSSDPARGVWARAGGGGGGWGLVRAGATPHGHKVACMQITHS